MSKIEIRDNIFRALIEQVKPNKWNPNKQSAFIFEKELKSIRDHGFLDPIDVRELEDGSYEIVDGEHRWNAAKLLGMKEVPVNNLGKVSVKVAKQLTVIRNETRGQTERTALSDLLHDLIINDGAGVDELKSNLPLDPLDIDSLLKDLDVDWGNSDAPEGDPGSAQDDPGAPGTERMTYVLPGPLADRFRAQLERFRLLANGGEKVGVEKKSHQDAFESLVAYLEAANVKEPI